MASEILSQIIDPILSIADSLGYLGISILMAIESSFIPFPSEVVLIPAGALIAQGKMNFSLVLIFSLIGSLIGAYVNYAVAYYGGRKLVSLIVQKYGSLLLISGHSLLKTESFFEKHGAITTFVGRLLPGIRQLISLPAGLAKMNLIKFTLYTALGAGIWSSVLIVLGYLFQSNRLLIEQYLKQITWIAIIACLTAVVIYIFFHRKSSEKILKRTIPPMPN